MSLDIKIPIPLQPKQDQLLKLVAAHSRSSMIMSFGASAGESDAMSHAQDWRKRVTNHKQNVAGLLVERASEGMGVRSIEDLYSHPELYGVSPRNRISELGKEGWQIGRKPCGNGTFYWLCKDGQGRTYPQTRRFDEPPNSPRPQLVKQPEIAWADRKAATGLPLFDLAVRQ